MAPLDASRLEALLESAQVLQSLDLDELLRHLLRTAMGRLLVTRACIAVRDEEGGVRVALARGAGALAAGQVFDERRAHAAGMVTSLPIGAATEPIGVLAFGQPPQGRLEDEAPFLQALLGMGASAIANARAHAKAARLTGELGQKVQELRTLLDLVRGFAAAQEPDEVAQMLGLTLAGRWAVGRYAIAAWMPGHTPVVRRRGIVIDDVQALEPCLDDIREGAAIAELPDSPLAAVLRAQDARLVLPIRTASVRGFAAVGARTGGRPFDEASAEFGSALAAQAAVAFENAWRLRETLVRKKAEQELALAATIQKGLFPADLPSLPGHSFAAYNRPASQVGGDYYDAIRAESGPHAGQCLLCVADVSGKGLPAALLMSTIQATLRALHSRAGSLVDLVAEASELLFASTPGNKYATVILARLETSGALTYVNAGHARCLLVRAGGGVEVLEPCGPPIGLLPGMSWEERSLMLGDSDMLALFSDGVTEAWNDGEEEFGEDRIVEVLRAAPAETAAQCVARLVAAIDLFAGSAPQHDDITIMLLRRGVCSP